jgi:hypothetical protein
MERWDISVELGMRLAPDDLKMIENSQVVKGNASFCQACILTLPAFIPNAGILYPQWFTHSCLPSLSTAQRTGTN